MKFAVRLFVFGLLASMYLAAPASAQYMKITTNNATDNTKLNPTGTTQLTITLDTNHDKDNSLQTCNSHSAANCGATGNLNALNLFSYQVYLRAVGGTVSWGAFAPDTAAFAPLVPQASDATDVEFTFARPPGTSSPPGFSSLGKINVTIVTGSPSISIVRFPENASGTLDPSGFGTVFGTNCDGNVIGNSYILGFVADPCGLISGLPSDWYDADGAGAPAGTNSAPVLAQPTNMTVNEGATANQALNATDADNDPITFSLVSGPTFATVTTTTPGTGTGIGNLHLAPGFADQGSNISVTVRASDGAGNNDKTLSVTVNNVNRAPTLNPISNMTVNEGATADQALTGTDPDSDPLTFTRATGPAFFTVASANAHLAPLFTDSGTYAASATASDGTATDTKSFTITVNNVDRPVTLNSVADMSVAAGATSDQLITAIDADEAAITFTFTGPAYMTVTPNAQVTTTRTANIHLAPPGGTAAGTVNASVTATANAVTATENFVITVTGGANQAPVLTQPANMTVNESATADQTLNATDADGNPLTFSLVTGPTYASVTTTTPGTGTGVGNLHLAPGFTDAGTATATVRANDGLTNNDKTLTITVTNVNRNPTLTQPANMTVNEGATANQTITAVDADDEPLTFSLVTGPTFASVTTTTPGAGTGTGNIHLAPGLSDSGTFAATVRASDGAGNNDKTLTITVNNTNQAPTLNAITNMVVAQGTTADQVITASDPDGDALTFTQISGPTFMTVTTTNATTGNIHLAPGASEPLGLTAASVRAADGALFSNVQPFTVTVTATNQAPTLAQPANMTVNEGATADQTLNATDPDGNPLNFSLLTGPGFATVTTTTPGTGTATGNLHLAPGSSDAGTYAAAVRASDGGLNNDKSLTITVNNVNQAPVLTQPSNMTVTEGATADQTLNATDADGQALSFSLASGPSFAAVTTTTPGTGTATGNVHLAPTTGDAGTYAATASVSDGSLTDDGTFTITVNPFVAGNDPPTLAQPSNMTVGEGATADQTLNATDPDGDALSFSLVTGPTFASVTTTTPGTGTAVGNIHLAPGFDDEGTYSATVRAGDGTENDDKTLTITVTGVSIPPVLAAINDMTVTEGATADQAISAFGEVGDLLSFTFDGPAFMTVTSNVQVQNTLTGNIHLAPPGGTTGTFSATVTVTAGGQTDSQTFTITVNPFVPGNEAPVLLQPTDMTVNEGATANQTLNATDADGDALTFSLLTGPGFATVTTTSPGTGTAAGNIHLAPTFTDDGTYTATVRVSDGTANNDKSLTITVNDINLPPVLAQPSNMTVNEGATADQTLTATEADFDAVTFTLVSGPTFASVTTTTPGNGTATGNLHLAPGASDSGTYLATVRASDGLAFDDKTLTITVNDVGGGNQPPVLTQPANMTVDEGATADQTLSATDPEGDTLIFSKAGGPAFMTVSGAGVVHLAPGFADAGTYTGTAQVSDGSLSDSKSFTITVNNVNRAPTADAGGPYAGVVNVAVNFSGTGSSDPDGDPLTYSWDFDVTNGIQEDATGPTPSHTYASAGGYTVTLTVADNGTPQLTDTDTATANISPTGFTVNTFLNGGSKNIKLNSGKPFWCVGLSPASASFEVTDIIVSSIRASFGGVSIPALRTRGLTDDEGEDGNGRLTVCFSKDNLRLLFASLGNGNQNVDVLITGDLVNGASFSGTVNVSVQKGGAGGLAKGKDDDHGFGHASPNPFNPSTTISFSLSQPGSVRLRIYNVSGRLVNTLTDGFMGSGPHEVRWNGTSTNGSRVSSGVYFFILETPERVVKSQLVVAK